MYDSSRSLYSVDSREPTVMYMYVVYYVQYMYIFPLIRSCFHCFPRLHSSCSTTNAEGFIDFYNETGTDFAYIAFNVTFTVGNSSDDNTFYKTLAWVCGRGCSHIHSYVYMQC